MRDSNHPATRRINLGGTAALIAHNLCRDCGYEWQDKPMGFAHFLTCPNCRCEYWHWLNYAGGNRPPPGR